MQPDFEPTERLAGLDATRRSEGLAAVGMVEYGGLGVVPQRLKSPGRSYHGVDKSGIGNVLYSQPSTKQNAALFGTNHFLSATGSHKKGPPDACR